jgi:hypothetical protein
VHLTEYINIKFGMEHLRLIPVKLIQNLGVEIADNYGRWTKFNNDHIMLKQNFSKYM